MSGGFMPSVEMRGTNRVKNQMRFLASMHPQKTNPIIRDHAKMVRKKLRMTPYPTYLPHFTHTRKGFFGGIAGSFSAKMKKLGVWIVSNSRLYAMPVIGKPEQKRQHPSFLRWWSMADEVSKNNKDLTRNLTLMLERELDNQ